MPVHSSLLKIENSFDSEFNNRMINFANRNNLEYLNFTNDSIQYSYTDGNHLYIKDAKKYSIRLAEKIKHFQNIDNKKLR
jgi:translation elongation factor P/translation initiation factor 5A